MIIMMLDIGLQQNAKKKFFKLIFIKLIIKYNLLLFIEFIYNYILNGRLLCLYEQGQCETAVQLNRTFYEFIL